MEKTKGKIEAVNQRDKNYGVLVGGQWYNGFGKCPYEKGQEVEFEWEHKGEFRNIRQKSRFARSDGNVNKLIEILAQNKVNFHIVEKVGHPNGEAYNMKEYGASHSVNLTELTAEKGAEIYGLLQRIVDEKKKKDAE